MSKAKGQKLKVKIDISYVAKLANLPLSEKESVIFQNQLTKILEYIDKIEQADTSMVEPTYNVSSNTNITREDKSGTSLTQNEALENASQSRNGLFATKGVFKSE